MMKLTPNENILRVALIVFSVLFGILSVSLIALGIVYIDELWWPKRYVGLDFIELPIMLIILGSLSLFMSVAGCFCAKTYNRFLLLMFAAILTVILCLELSIAVIAFINFDQHKEGNSQTHRLMLQDYENKKETMFIREMEKHYSCCGVFGNETECLSYDEIDYDYGDPDMTNSTGTGIIPLLGISGCALAVDEHLQTVSLEIGYFASILAVLQIVEIGYVCLIQRTVNNYYD